MKKVHKAKQRLLRSGEWKVIKGQAPGNRNLFFIQSTSRSSQHFRR